MNNRLRDLKCAFQKGEINKAQFIESMHCYHSLIHEYADIIGETEIAAIEITPGKAIYTSRAGVRFSFDGDDQRAAPLEAINFGTYERDDAAMIFRAVENCTTVFDIGANIGWYALHIAQRLPACRVFAFEPVPASFRLLEQNVEFNRASNVSIYALGFADHAGTSALYVYPEGLGGASLRDNSGRPSVYQFPAKMTTLDEFTEEVNTVPDLIKLDIEGAELLALRGGRRLLNTTSPILFVELLRKWAANFNYHPNDVIALLDSWGYQCYSASGPRLRKVTEITDDTSATNFLFLHRERHSSLAAAWNE